MEQCARDSCVAVLCIELFHHAPHICPPCLHLAVFRVGEHSRAYDNPAPIPALQHSWLFSIGLFPHIIWHVRTKHAFNQRLYLKKLRTGAFYSESLRFIPVEFFSFLRLCMSRLTALDGYVINSLLMKVTRWFQAWGLLSHPPPFSIVLCSF